MNLVPKISIITVCFQSAKTIRQTILSVIAQEYPNKEYIIIDGGSSDETNSIIEEYKEHIDIFISEPDQGIYDAMNKGIQKASGDIIGFLNADDLFAHHQVLTKISNGFMQHPDKDICFADLIYFKTENQKEEIVRYFKSSPFKQGAFAKGWCPPHPTFYAKKSVYQKYGGFDLRYAIGNDVEMMMRLLEKHKVNSFYLPEVLVKMRIGGVSNQSVNNILQQNKNILQAARNLKIPINPIRFIFFKLIDRVGQFIKRPVKT